MLAACKPGEAGKCFYMVVGEFEGKGETYFELLGEISGGTGKESSYSPTEFPGEKGEGGNVFLSSRIHIFIYM